MFKHKPELIIKRTFTFRSKFIIKKTDTDSPSNLNTLKSESDQKKLSFFVINTKNVLLNFYTEMPFYVADLYFTFKKYIF